MVQGEIFLNWLGAAAPPLESDLNAGFGGHLQWNSEWNQARQGVYVAGLGELAEGAHIEVGVGDRVEQHLGREGRRAASWYLRHLCRAALSALLAIWRALRTAGVSVSAFSRTKSWIVPL